MRLRAAAVLVITSAMVGVAGVLGVPGTAHADMRTPAVGDYTGVVKNPILEVFAQLEAATLTRYSLDHARDVRQLLEHAPAAATVAHWWSSLDSARRDALVGSSPRLVGNLDGIPLGIRDSVNRAELAKRLEQVSEAPASVPADEAERLRNITAALEAPVGSPERSLLLFDTTGEWRASIAVGDPATADFVSLLVPGMSVSVGEQVRDWVDRAQSLYDSQLEWLDRFGDEASVATIAWMGYHSPQVASQVTELPAALEGANRIESTLLGLRSLRIHDQPHLNVFAHSYGSTAALLALQRQSVSVDSLVVLGSPGSDATSVSALSVTGGNVYAASADFDPVAASGYFGSNPMSPGYGASILSVEGGIDPVSCRVLGDSLGHNEYFAEGSRSMRNLALIGIDRGDLALK